MKHFYNFLILILCVIISISANAQQNEYFYYSPKGKMPLELNVQSAILLFKEQPSESELQNLGISQIPEKIPQGYIDKLWQEKLGYAADLYAVEVFLPYVQSEAEYETIYNQWLQSDKLLVAMPCFKVERFEKVRLGSIFYVKLKSEQDIELLQNQAEYTGAVILEQNRFMPLWFTLANPTNNGFLTLEIANNLHESNLFDYVEADLMPVDKMPEGTMEAMEETQNTKKTTPCVNDSEYKYQWALENTGYYYGNNTQSGIDIKACPAWEYSKGSNVKVAIFSSDFPNDDYPDFIGRICNSGYDAFTGTSPSIKWLLGLDCGAGAAGVIGAEQNNNFYITGIAPECQLMHISSLTNYPYANYLQNAADGINWAWKIGQADIINLLNHATKLLPSQMLTEAFNNATTYGRSGKGCIIVAPSGTAFSLDVAYPANLENILAVGAIDWNGLRVSYGAYGSELDVVAPSFEIVSYGYWNGALGYVNYDGLDMGPAHVAGIAALVLAINPDLPWQRVHNIITSTAQKIRQDVYSYDQNKPQGTWNEELGYGLVSAHEAVYKASCSGNAVSPSYTTGPFTLWDTEQLLDGTFEVQSGHTLVITSHVSCKENAKIFVHKGGTLIMDGGVLSACRNTWQGIELEGDYCFMTGSENPARLYMKNKARIENAVIGIYTANTQGNPSGLLFSAGIIYADGTVFSNCQTAVAIDAFSNNPNATAPMEINFMECTFEVTHAFPFPLNHESLVKLVYTNEVTFSGCTFSNTRDDGAYYYTDGITSIGSRYKVTSWGDVRSQFYNLRNGIYAYDDNQVNNAITIARSDFNITKGYGTGVFLFGCAGAKVVSNNFNVSELTTGLDMWSCENYQVEGNYFNGTTSGSESASQAIFVMNAHGKNEVIYRNEISNFTCGIYACYNRNNNNPSEGLQIQCNNFNSNSTHISSYDMDGLANVQGSYWNPAGNEFHNTGWMDFVNMGYAITYYHGNDYKQIPCNYINLSLQQTPYDNTCPSNIDYYSTLQSVNLQPLQKVQQQYQAQTDGGNTVAMLAETEVTTNKISGMKTQEKLQKSKGFLSNKILLAVARNENGFTPEMVRDIMAANPQCTRNKEVMKALKERIKPLDAKMMKEILAGEKVISPREKLEMKIADEGRKITNAIDDNLRLLTADSLDHTKEIVDQLNYFDIPEYQYQLAQLYFDKNEDKNYKAALTHLDKLITYDEDKQYFHRWCKLNDDITHWTKNDKYRLDSLPENILQHLIDMFWVEEGRLQAKAASILALNGIFITPERKRGEMPYDDKKIIPEPMEMQVSDAAFTVQPNPAKESVTFSYQMDEDAAQAVVYIYHSSGSLVETIHLDSGSSSKTINTVNLNNGVYYCRYIVNGQTIKTVKLMIAK